MGRASTMRLILDVMIRWSLIVRKGRGQRGQFRLESVGGTCRSTYTMNL